MSKDLKAQAARRDRRTRAAVATVAPTSAGTAACRAERDLFDQAGSARAPLTVRTKAASFCATCPFTATCGFRISMPKARFMYRNRT